MSDYSNRVQKFTSNGTLVTMWGGFFEPFDVATNHAGHVYVADVRNSRIQKFDSAGNFLAAWEGPWGGVWHFEGIGTNADNHVYAVDCLCLSELYPAHMHGASNTS